MILLIYTLAAVGAICSACGLVAGGIDLYRLIAKRRRAKQHPTLPRSFVVKQ